MSTPEKLRKLGAKFLPSRDASKNRTVLVIYFTMAILFAKFVNGLLTLR